MALGLVCLPQSDCALPTLLFSSEVSASQHCNKEDELDMSVWPSLSRITSSVLVSHDVSARVQALPAQAPPPALGEVFGCAHVLRSFSRRHCNGGLVFASVVYALVEVLWWPVAPLARTDYAPEEA